MLRVIEDPLYLVSIIISLLIALTVHEYAHARVALSFGDTTAKGEGRLTLNPISHLDPIGTLMILIAGFGWARPVPINPLRFRDLRKGLLWVSLAGIIANLILAFVSLFLYFLLFRFGVRGEFFSTLMITLVQLNLILAVFNLLPIPPLDGSKIVQTFLNRQGLEFYRQIEPYGMIILLILLFTRLLGGVLFGATRFIFNIYETVILFFMNLLF